MDIASGEAGTCLAVLTGAEASWGLSGHQAKGTTWGPPCFQVAVKNNIDVFYFSTLYPLHILFVEDGKMGES